MNSTSRAQQRSNSSSSREQHSARSPSSDDTAQQPVLTRQFKLISVNFKEAALDSPSFRASVNHLDIQVDNIEKWLIAISSSVKKIPRYVNDLQSFCNSFLEHLTPTFLQEGLIDQEYTVPALHTTLAGLKKIWGLSFQALNVNLHALEEIDSFIYSEVPRYKELRKKFDEKQAKYDKYLSVYVSIPKAKETPMVMDDARELFLVRKEYIHVSLDLIIQLQNLGNKLNKLFVNMNAELFRSKWNVFSPLNSDSTFRDQWEKVQKIQHWNDSYATAVDKLTPDMLSAREQVEEGCHIQFQPSLNADDYRTFSINAKSLDDIDEQGIEKHGYLFMKTWTEKSSKPIWVRRWAFIKGGIFGLLVLSPSHTFVQETDKLGVLLCNVRYNPNEDRRFCFEVRTSDITLVFQAESLIELKSWIKVFQNEKNRVLGTDEEEGLVKIASGRYPPIILELASTLSTVMDREFTSTRIVNAEGQIITSSTLSNHIEKNEKYFQKYIYFQIPRIRPPFITDTTKSSIIAYSLASVTSVPTALTANIWGSVNWGIYYLHDLVQDGPPISTYGIEPDHEMIEYQEDNLGNGIYHPSYYPKELVSLDIQMRSLFESAIEPGEYCILSFSCIWSPNSMQELGGRCFITTHRMYFYMQASGFIALFKGFVGSLVSVDYTSQKQYDLLKIYNVNGIIKMKLFLDDGKLIKKKLVYIINNVASDKPKPLREVLAELAEIEVKLSKGLPSSEKRLILGDASSLVPAIEGKQSVHKVDFSDEYDLVGDSTFDLPPKAIFHALLGDNSVIFTDETVFTVKEYYIKKPWRTSSRGTLYRKLNVPAKYGTNLGEVHIRQEIDNMEDNSYYTFTYARSKFTFFYGPRFSAIYKIVIVGIAGKRSRVMFYCKAVFDRSTFYNWMLKRFCVRVDMSQIKRIQKRLKQAEKEVGKHGMIVKSIYLYGKLSHTDEPEEELPDGLVKFGFGFVARFMLIRMTNKAVTTTYNTIMQILRLLIIFLKSVRMNQFLLFIIFGSTLLNLYLFGKTTTSYWTAKRANQLAREYVTKDPIVLQRSVYLKDIQEHVNNRNISFGNPKVFGLFKNISFVHSFNYEPHWTDDYFDDNTRDVAKQLRLSFQEIGVKRHELLVKLNILNDMEREIAQAEWNNWLMSEVQRCDYLKENILDSLKIDENVVKGIETVMGFCEECREALAGLI
ncbi:uncharacterized protein SPAPADRAFT_145586 [Spathaspora passalidarum NRRL Y-27907]|uniref:Uncharacterized protein n=1 Tax=Spathaspora passalidarum (strain NRRL Y-27907 / 11-Y1) TaxID=619300 RepID=G3AFE1_SPAPN|nr:uncharacterized protein SPAPADRAFT_145586 [Spathaspora passalidarum NRRL Y-27907]EGW34930.1 hypothetical protein SPAPADRAFT_145586 [Spathaspora passalidarum NRRL Y-27907]